MRRDDRRYNCYAAVKVTRCWASQAPEATCSVRSGDVPSLSLFAEVVEADLSVLNVEVEEVDLVLIGAVKVAGGGIGGAGGKG